MIKVNINSETDLKINEKPLIGEFEVTPNKITHFIGENGIGKSTLFHFLKINLHKQFTGKNVRFVDQSRLSPLNDVSYNDLKTSLKEFKVSDTMGFEIFDHLCEPFSHLAINKLSGGQNQMVKLSVALYLGGDFFFLDEPFQFLDHKNQKVLLDILSSLKKEGKGVAIIEHQVDISKIVDHTFKFIQNTDQISLGAYDGI